MNKECKDIVHTYIEMYMCVCVCVLHVISLTLSPSSSDYVCVHVNIYTVSNRYMFPFSHILPYIASFTTRGIDNIEQNVLCHDVPALFRSRKCG